MADTKTIAEIKALGAKVDYVSSKMDALTKEQEMTRELLGKLMDEVNAMKKLATANEIKQNQTLETILSRIEDIQTTPKRKTGGTESVDNSDAILSTPAANKITTIRQLFISRCTNEEDYRKLHFTGPVYDDLKSKCKKTGVAEYVDIAGKLFAKSPADSTLKANLKNELKQYLSDQANKK